MSSCAIITGAGSGIGRATAHALAAAGYALVLVGRRAGPLRATAARLDTETAVCDADVTDPAASGRPVDEALERWGRVDALVNNAGTVETAPIEANTDDLLGRMLAVHAVAPARLIARVWPVFAEQGSGCIVNVSSMATLDPFPGLSAYAAAKSALESLTRSAVNEGRGHGIRAFSVAPGAVETAMLRSIVSKDELPEAQALRPADVAEVILECVTGKRDAEIGRVIRVEK